MAGTQGTGTGSASLTAEEREQFYEDWCEKVVRIMIPMSDRLWEQFSWFAHAIPLRLW